MLQERAEESTENANPSRISRKDYVSLYSDFRAIRCLDKLEFDYSSDDCCSNSYCSADIIFLSSVIAFSYSFS